MFVTFCGMSLAPVESASPILFSTIDLASRYGGKALALYLLGRHASNVVCQDHGGQLQGVCLLPRLTGAINPAGAVKDVQDVPGRGR
jgi:hypothetical protein